MIPEHGDHRNPQRGELLHQDARLIRQPVVGEVPGEQQELRRFGHAGKERLEGPLRRFGAMKVGEGGNTDDLGAHIRFGLFKSYAR